NELRAVEKACRPHGPAIEDERGERRCQAERHEPFQHVTPTESVCTVRAAGVVRQCAHDVPPWLFILAVAERSHELEAVAQRAQQGLRRLPDIAGHFARSRPAPLPTRRISAPNSRVHGIRSVTRGYGAQPCTSCCTSSDASSP